MSLLVNSGLLVIPSVSVNGKFNLNVCDNVSQSQKSKSALLSILPHVPVHTYRELKLRYSLTPWCIQITLNTNSRTQKYR